MASNTPSSRFEPIESDENDEEHLLGVILKAFNEFRHQTPRPQGKHLQENPAYKDLRHFIDKKNVPHSNTGLHPINRLPLELLCHIFKIAADDDLDVPLTIIRISQTWRDLALNMASLWSAIYISGSRHETWEHTHTYLSLSRQAALQVTISSGSRAVLPRIEQIFGDNWARVHTLECISRAAEGVPSIGHLLSMMTELRVLNVDTYQETLPQVIRTTGFPNLWSMSSVVHSTTYLHELLESTINLPRLQSLRLLLARRFHQDQPFRRELLAPLRVRELLVSDASWFNPYIQEYWLESLLLISSVTTLKLFVENHRLPYDFVKHGRALTVNSNLESLTLSMIPDLFEVLSVFNPSKMIGLSSLFLSIRANSVGSRKLIQLLSKFTSLEEVKVNFYEDINDWTDDSPFQVDNLEIYFPNLVQLSLHAHDTLNMEVLRGVRAPRLQELVISKTRQPKISKLSSPDCIDSLLSSCKELHVFKLLGIDWPATEVAKFPELRWLRITSPRISDVRFDHANSQPLELEWAVSDPPSIPIKRQSADPSLDLPQSVDRTNKQAVHPIPVSNAPAMPSYLHSIETLTIKFAVSIKRRNLAEDFPSILPSLNRLRVFHLPYEYGTLMPIDVLAENLLFNMDWCPRLEEIHSTNYPTDWNQLLDFIMSRNLLPINTTGGDAKSSYTKRARLSFIMFAQPIHKDIHNLVVDAFAGEIVPVVPPWNLPADLEGLYRCNGCIKSRVHYCAWSEHHSIPTLKRLEGYCVRHLGVAKNPIGRYTPKIL